MNLMNLLFLEKTLENIKYIVTYGSQSWCFGDLYFIHQKRSVNGVLRVQVFIKQVICSTMKKVSAPKLL